MINCIENNGLFELVSIGHQRTPKIYKGIISKIINKMFKGNPIRIGRLSPRYRKLFEDIKDFNEQHYLTDTCIVKMSIFSMHSFFFDKLPDGKTRYELCIESKGINKDQGCLAFIRRFRTFDKTCRKKNFE